MEVVAAVILRNGNYLLSQRPTHKSHGGLWEFPGGKVLPNESRCSAIKRELTEELGVLSSPLYPSPPLRVELDTKTNFHIYFIETEIYGEPRSLEHQKMGWFKPSDVLKLPLAPADAEFAASFLRDK